MNEVEKLSFDEVNVGDVIAIPCKLDIRWTEHFRYVRYQEETVTKVTPKRTKIVTDKETVLMANKNTIYKANKETIRRTEVAEAVEFVYNYMVGNINFNLQEFLKKDDDAILSIAILLRQVDKLMSE